MTMKIKRFDDILNESRVTSNSKILKKLKASYAIGVKKEDTDRFLTILSTFDSLEIPGSGTIPQFTANINYFILFGDKVIHTTVPTFGGTDFKVFTPNIY